MKNAVVLIFLLCSSTTWGQKIADWIAEGDMAMEENRFYDASEYYRKAYELDSSNYLNTIKFADALRYCRSYSRALNLYSKAYDKDRGRITPRALMHIADLQYITGDYKPALKNFRKYKKKIKVKSSLEYQWMEQRIAQVQYAINHERPNPKVLVDLAKGNINGAESEMAPFMKDSTLYITQSGNVSEQQFTRIASFEYDGELFMGEDDATWPEKYEANYSMSEDGKYGVFVRCESLRNCSIWLSTFDENGQIIQTRALDEINNSEANNTMPSLSKIDGNYVLFFCSDRSGSLGGLDIWWSVLGADGTFQKAKALYEAINSPGEETSPFYLDGQLYFSSNWWEGYGGLDVFSVKGKPGFGDQPDLWGIPKNMELPINSSYNDLYFSYNVDNQMGFISSNREPSPNDAGSYCCSDIFVFQHTDSVYQKKSMEQSLLELNAYLPVTLYFHNDEPDPNTRSTTTTKSYLDAYESYIGLKQSYIQENEKGLQGDQKDEAKFETEDFFAQFVEKGKNDLEVFSQELLKELEKGTSVSLAVRGFASPRAESDYNERLTKRRIASLDNHLQRYQGGIFLPFMEKDESGFAQLSLLPQPFGESKAQDDVNADLDNQQASIYSIQASLERKIEIEAVAFNPNPNRPKLLLEETALDLGAVSASETVRFMIPIANDGYETMIIDSVSSSCQCTLPQLDKNIFQPGEKANIAVDFDPTGYNGEVVREVYIYKDGESEPRVVTFRAKVVR